MCSVVCYQASLVCTAKIPGRPCLLHFIVCCGGEGAKSQVAVACHWQARITCHNGQHCYMLKLPKLRSRILLLHQELLHLRLLHLQRKRGGRIRSCCWHHPTRHNACGRCSRGAATVCGSSSCCTGHRLGCGGFGLPIPHQPHGASFTAADWRHPPRQRAVL